MIKQGASLGWSDAPLSRKSTSLMAADALNSTW
jgi:hypothetical protein